MLQIRRTNQVIILTCVFNRPVIHVINEPKFHTTQKEKEKEKTRANPK